MNFIKSWNDRRIRIREDRYVCLTDMAQAVGKLFGGWNRLESTKSYLATLSSVMQIDATDLVQVIQGGDPQKQGTWGHPKVALRFAQWCSDEFAVQVDFWIDELVTTGNVSILESNSPVPTSEIELAGHALDVAFAGVGLNPALLAGLKLNAISAVHPQLRGYLDEGRKFIASTNTIESELLSPTAIGKKMRISAQQVNVRLIEAGLQEENPNHGKYGHKREPRYLPTDRGREFCEITLATGRNTSTSFQQIKWYESVMGAIVSTTPPTRGWGL